ncbi:MAG TPA: S8 family serine peptidase, partial [Kiritimatiellia bacterium]|nr:S8 family serine peptidase [Kiritimatiellia bacterium]
PELVAPGTHVTGGVPQAPTPLDIGMALACYDASWICALPGGGSAGNVSNFFPLGQQWYSTGSGTSHATAAAAGGAALVWQYFVNRGWGVPSPAMVKAYMMNSARYMTGTNANDTLWSSAQGMGMVDLDRAFDGTPRLLRDQQGVDTFTNSGTSRSFTGAVCKAYLPVRITLSWTDAPGSTAGNAYKNDLNLSVKADGKTYLGNVFTGAFSTTGGVADVRNNVESVFLPPGTTGLVEITVTAFNINSDGVPNVPPTLDQDFALVAYNLAAVNISAINKVSATNYATRLLSMTNTQYRLDFTRNLATNPVLWTPIVTNAGTGGEITLIDSGNGMDPKRYYRVVQP